MMTVWKFPLNKLVGRNIVDMPKGAQVLHAGIHHNVLNVWALVDSTAPTVQYYIYAVGTGHPVPDGVKHVSTLVDGDFIWHVFVEPSVKYHA